MHPTKSDSTKSSYPTKPAFTFTTARSATNPRIKKSPVPTISCAEPLLTLKIRNLNMITMTTLILI